VRAAIHVGRILREVVFDTADPLTLLAELTADCGADGLTIDHRRRRVLALAWSKGGEAIVAKVYPYREVAVQ